VNSEQNTKLQQKHCNETHHSSVIIIIISIITVTANLCSLFTVQRLSDCHCMLLYKKRRLFCAMIYRWIF